MDPFLPSPVGACPVKTKILENLSSTEQRFPEHRLLGRARRSPDPLRGSRQPTSLPLGLIEELIGRGLLGEVAALSPVLAHVDRLAVVVLEAGLDQQQPAFFAMFRRATHRRPPPLPGPVGVVASLYRGGDGRSQIPAASNCAAYATCDATTNSCVQSPAAGQACDPTHGPPCLGDTTTCDSTSATCLRMPAGAACQ